MEPRQKIIFYHLFRILTTKNFGLNASKTKISMIFPRKVTFQGGESGNIDFSPKGPKSTKQPSSAITFRYLNFNLKIPSFSTFPPFFSKIGSKVQFQDFFSQRVILKSLYFTFKISKCNSPFFNISCWNLKSSIFKFRVFKTQQMN